MTLKSETIIVWASLRQSLVLDIVIIQACLTVSAIAFWIFLTDKSGTKGLTKEYKTKSGVKHTARKDREKHII